MITLSKHQRGALESLRDGEPHNSKHVGERVGVTAYVATSILDILRSRGLVSVRGSGAGGPRRYLWIITVAGHRVLAEPAL